MIRNIPTGRAPTSPAYAAPATGRLDRPEGPDPEQPQVPPPLAARG